jgi:hypothetical protein
MPLPETKKIAKPDIIRRACRGKKRKERWEEVSTKPTKRYPTSKGGLTLINTLTFFFFELTPLIGKLHSIATALVSTIFTSAAFSPEHRPHVHPVRRTGWWSAPHTNGASPRTPAVICNHTSLDRSAAVWAHVRECGCHSAYEPRCVTARPSSGGWWNRSKKGIHRVCDRANHPHPLRCISLHDYPKERKRKVKVLPHARTVRPLSEDWGDKWGIMSLQNRASTNGRGSRRGREEARASGTHTQPRRRYREGDGWVARTSVPVIETRMSSAGMPGSTSNEICTPSRVCPQRYPGALRGPSIVFGTSEYQC